MSFISDCCGDIKEVNVQASRISADSVVTSPVRPLVPPLPDVMSPLRRTNADVSLQVVRPFGLTEEEEKAAFGLVSINPLKCASKGLCFEESCPVHDPRDPPFAALPKNKCVRAPSFTVNWHSSTNIDGTFDEEEDQYYRDRVMKDLEALGIKPNMPLFGRAYKTLCKFGGEHGHDMFGTWGLSDACSKLCCAEKIDRTLQYRSNPKAELRPKVPVNPPALIPNPYANFVGDAESDVELVSDTESPITSVCDSDSDHSNSFDLNASQPCALPSRPIRYVATSDDESSSPEGLAKIRRVVASAKKNPKKNSSKKDSKKEPLQRGRNWCFTVNNPTLADMDMLRKACTGGLVTTENSNIANPGIMVRYMIVGREVGEMGTPHLQGFVCFDQPKSLLQVKRHIHGTAHWEIALGNVDQNVIYCSKEDKEPFTFGYLLPRRNL